MLRLKRVYEPAEQSDGTRILVERLWPRGLTKRRARVDLWLKDVAPSAPLRKWFAHDPLKWKEFQTRYRKELKKCGDAIKELRRKSREGRVTLVYAAHDEKQNSALVLKRYLEGRR